MSDHKKLFQQLRQQPGFEKYGEGIIKAQCPVNADHGMSLRIYGLHPDGLGIECVERCPMDSILQCSMFDGVAPSRCIDIARNPHIAVLRYHFIVTSELRTMAAGKVEWFRPDVFPKGASVSLTGLTKGGKSTFVFSECAKVDTSVQIFMVSEESPLTLRLKTERFGLGDNFHVVSRPPLLCWSTWSTFADSLYCGTPAGSIIILDTTQRLSRNPDCMDAENAVKMIVPFEQLTERGDCVVHMEHSPRKGGHARGSSAQDGAVDWLVNLCRMKSRDVDGHRNPLFRSNRRQIVCQGRLADTESVFLVQLDGDRYERVDNEADAAMEVSTNIESARTEKRRKEREEMKKERATDKLGDAINGEPMTAKQAAKAVGCTEQYAKRGLDELVANGTLWSDGKRPAKYQRVEEPQLKATA